MNASTDLAVINQAVKNATELLAFDLRLVGSTYQLELTVGRKHEAVVTLICRDVQNLELNPTGTGFSRLLRLEIEDLREEKLDRVHFSVEEVQQETLFFHCADLELKKI